MSTLSEKAQSQWADIDRKDKADPSYWGSNQWRNDYRQYGDTLKEKERKYGHNVDDNSYESNDGCLLI